MRVSGVRRSAAAMTVMLVGLVGCAGGSDRGAAHTTTSPTSTSPTDRPARQPTQLVDDCRSAHVRPRTMVYACGDAGVTFSGVRWSSWHQGHAVGVARTVGVKNGCCHSHVVRHVRLTAFAPRPYKHGARAFACLRVRPGLARGDDSDLLSLVSATWFGRLDDPRAAYRPCPHPRK